MVFDKCSSMECRFLSSDIIFDILGRTSLQTLGRCRSVCKEWNLITYESTFLHHYCQRSQAIAGFFIQTLRNNVYFSSFVHFDQPNPTIQLSLDFLPGPMKIEASTNQGFLFCLNQKPRNHRIPEYFLCKPSTKQWRKMPNPKTRYFTERTAMIVLRSNPLVFKIVRFSSWDKPRVPFKGFDYLQCEIFDSEKWAWKQLRKKIELPHCVFLSLEPAVSACGALHWLTTHNHIFSFHEDEEDWKIFPLPQQYFEEHCVKLVEYEGKLAFMCMQRKEECCMELWVLEDSRKKVWSKRRTLSLENIIRNDCSTVSVGFCNADVALFRGFFRAIFYRFQDCSGIEVKLEYLPQEFFPLQSDFETVDLMRKQ